MHYYLEALENFEKVLNILKYSKEYVYYDIMCNDAKEKIKIIWEKLYNYYTSSKLADLELAICNTKTQA